MTLVQRLNLVMQVQSLLVVVAHLSVYETIYHSSQYKYRSHHTIGDTGHICISRTHQWCSRILSDYNYTTDCVSFSVDSLDI